MPESFTISRVLPATPQQVYEAWLDDAQHTEMTGALASCEAKPGGKFMAWEGYIEGPNVELKPFERIVQNWRTSEFPDAASDSLVEINLEPSNGGTLFTLTHTNIPDGQGDRYKVGWVDQYLDPMHEYFRTIY